jgi:hypothetical protein
VRTVWLLLAIAALAVAAPAGASGGDQPSGRRCVTAEEAEVHAAGDDPPKFTSAFSARTITLNASLDGMDGTQLPISIEEICDIPKSLAKQAVRLAGTDGVALLSTRTSVWLDGQSLQGEAALTALDGADTAVLRVRLAPQRRWGEDEDGAKVPTFTARRITITD